MRYLLDQAASTVAFGYTMGGNPARGTMPVKTADIRLDLDNIPASSVVATVDAAAARAGIVFATQAMRSPLVLYTARHPEIVFRSTRITGNVNSARIEGEITIRGVTRPITLDAQVFRQFGTEVGDRRKLSILLRGSVNRSEFGADGYPGFVGEIVTLDILTRITLAE